MMQELDLPLELPSVALTDSQTVVRSLSKPLTMKNKHVGVYLEYVKHLIKGGTLKVFRIPREDNFADLATKMGSTKDFVDLARNMNSFFKRKHIYVEG